MSGILAHRSARDGGPAMLGSPQWFGRLAAVLSEEVASQSDVMRGADFCFQEVLTGVPPDRQAVAWHVKFSSGQIVALGYGSPIGDADVQQTLAWTDALPLAMAMKTDPRFDDLAGRLVERGRITISGDLSLKLARSQVFDRVHDRLAPLTTANVTRAPTGH